MKNLNLKGLKQQYTKVNKGKKEIYYNEELNNLILINPLDKDCDTYTICNGIFSDAYDELIACLNEYVNVVVHWSQISGTTSDYTIYHDMNSSLLKKKSISEILVELHDSVVEPYQFYKYKEVLDGIENPIEFDRNDTVIKREKLTASSYIDHINCRTHDNRIENLRTIKIK